MAVTTAQVVRSRGGERGNHPMKTGAKCPEGSLAFLNAGYAEAGIDTGSNKFAGIVVTSADNTDGSYGDLRVEVKRRGQFLLTGSGFAITDKGANVYASDNFTITKTSPNNVLVGTIADYVSSTQVWVEIDGAAV